MQVIDYNAIKKNAEFFRKQIGTSKLCAVLKNDAYGHGLVHVARHIVEFVDIFAVGSCDEAEQIQFLNKDILILLPQNLRNAERAIIAGYILTVDSLTTCQVVEKAMQNTGKTARVHVKIDSGMSRLGVQDSEIQLLCDCANFAKMSIEGIFSHFYGDTLSECDKQFDRFIYSTRLYNEIYGRPVVRHIANTGATLLSDKYHLDMVRVGLGLFGYGDDNLLPVKKVYADVISVKDVRAGSVVGYGGKYKCDKDSKIAVINVGYANGLPRCLVGSNISVNGQFCVIAGICMAMTLLDVTELKVDIGDKAILLGDGVNISNDKVIIYELLCNLR